MSGRPTLAVTMGDPAGIGPEIILKSLKDPRILASLDVIVCGSARVFSERAAALNLDIQLLPDAGIDLLADASLAGDRYRVGNAVGSFRLWEPSSKLAHLPTPEGYCFREPLIDEVLALVEGRVSVVPGSVNAANGLLAYLSISLAHHACVSGAARAMATAPVHKEALRAAEVPFIGHTEILGGLCAISDPLTMFETGGLRIFFHSRHVSLRKACDLVTRDRVLNSIRRCHDAMGGLGLPSRKIAVAALNPHGGEHGLFGDEDDIHVAPAVADARTEGIDAFGPIGADSVFYQARIGQWDAVLSLYHDQGHIAAKTLDFDRTISVTLGLPYLRTSVDHGTAMDIAGTGLARELSMTEAILVAGRYL